MSLDPDDPTFFRAAARRSKERAPSELVTPPTQPTRRVNVLVTIGVVLLVVSWLAGKMAEALGFL